MKMVILRAALVFGVIEQIRTGAWPLLWPRGFYDAFPLPGHPWPQS
jgi:hypothetical protein